MAGHSQFANIKHRKGAQDAKKAKIFTKILREITVSAKSGQPDPNFNPRLRNAIIEARNHNLPKDRVEAAIKKVIAGNDNDNFEEIRYEGYGVGGVALIVDTMTDNKVRTVAEVRHALNKHGGNLGTEGSVAFQFKHCGQLLLAPGTSEDAVMEAALDAGADDVLVDEDGAVEVLTSPTAFEAVKAALDAAGLQAGMAEVTYRPEVTIDLNDDDRLKMQKIIDALEELDDVQEVFHNAAL